MKAQTLILDIPRYIGICGHPKSGKSEVQDILYKLYGVKPVDDGGPLREIAMRYLGLSYQDVYTQEGKLRNTEILGSIWNNREILGELGNRFEAMFGKHIMPHMAVSSIKNEPGNFSFGSVRRDQGLYYKQRGGLVLGINNPGAGPSNFEFDQFDASVVDIWITNDALFKGMDKPAARLDLEKKIWDALAGHTLQSRAAA